MKAGADYEAWFNAQSENADQDCFKQKHVSERSEL